MTTTERHNAYGWIKPAAARCHRCGKAEYATPVDGFVVQECTRCSRLICEDHADTDADCDQDGYFQTEWVCKGDARTECKRIEGQPIDARASATMNWTHYGALFEAIDILDHARLAGGDFSILTHAREEIRKQAMDIRSWPDIEVNKFVRPREGVDANLVRRF